MKSVYTKFLIMFVVIILISFAALSSIISALFTHYTIEQKKELILHSSKAVVSYMENDCKIVDEDSFEDALVKEYNSIRSFISLVSPIDNELLFIICDANGFILIQDSNIPYGYIAEDISPEVMKQVNQSGETTRVNLDKVFRTDAYSYCYGTPYYGENGEFICAVFVATASERLGEIVDELGKIIIITSLLVMVVAIVAIYFMCGKIVAPLRRMSIAAKKFAKGDFEARVKVTGKDEIAELAQSFNNMAEQLAMLEDTKRAFLANIAHDLRTPMTTISGFIDAILDGAIPYEKQAHYLDIIKNEVQRLSRLVSQLLDISRIEAGDRKFNFENFNISSMAANILISFEKPIEQKHLDVEFDSEEDDMFVVADKDAIHQVLYNICHNAVKFSREGGKYRIRISKISHKVYVSVYNEGVGIPEKDLPFVFERFYKTDKSRGLDKTGVGLGMYITKTIIDAHGEEIWVKSEAGEFCEFVFTLKEGEKRKNRPLELN